MEDELIRLLAGTQAAADPQRKQAEAQLDALYTNPSFALGLVSVASHESVPLNIRQSALLKLRQFILAGWSPQNDEFRGQVLVSDEYKAQIRRALLDITVSEAADRKVKSAASYAVSKIASSDFPEQWPDLLPFLLHLIPQATDSQLHGALKVLNDLVDGCLNDEQFFRVARDLVKVVYDVAVSEARKPSLRAFAVSVFRGCFDILEMVLENHKAEVKAFAEEALSHWLPFFIEVIKMRLPEPPSEADENQETPASTLYRGLVSLKLQVVKVLMRIRPVFPSMLAPQSLVIFLAIWDELSALQAAYHQMYIEGERQGRLEDADNLPYTLDFLVLEELDFMQTCLRAAPVKKELEQQLQTQANQPSNWVTEVTKLAIAYAQITTEEEGLWNVDVNIFLSEETSVTANYTPRTACGELIMKLCGWLDAVAIDGLLAYTRSLYSTTQSWKAKEAALFILNQVLTDFQEMDKSITPEAANGFTDFVRYAMQQSDDFLRARGYLVAASLTRSSENALQQISVSLVEASLQAINNDESDVVKVSCIRALQNYLQALPLEVTQPMQGSILAALSNFLSTQDLGELSESDDLMVTLIQTLKDTILLDCRVCLTGNGLNLLFTLASHGANNFQLTVLVNETFEEITTTTKMMGDEAYIRLCEKVLPSLTGVFDVGTLTEENALTNLAAELLSVLAEHGSEPLPNGFIAAAMPKLTRLLLNSQEEELLKAATSAVKNIVIHGHKQLFEWHDETGKGGLEVILHIIDRLLSPDVDDNAAAEVGALAAEVVEKAGSERLGPYLTRLLRAVADRLGSATQAQFIQSLTLVFARLSLHNAREVVDFLAGIQVGQENGLQAVMSKWLENCVTFAGYDEIRQNVIALSKLYDLEDIRLAQVMVKGDLIVPQSDRIMTRSRTRQTPDQYTIVSAQMKILKVLVEELLSSAGPAAHLSPTNAAHAFGSASASLASPANPASVTSPGVPSSIDDTAAPAPAAANPDADEDDDEEDDEWEDDPDVLDLALGTTKAELMALGGEPLDSTSPSAQSALAAARRERDDETQAFLVQFFQQSSQRPGFEEAFSQLTEREKAKLRGMSNYG